MGFMFIKGLNSCSIHFNNMKHTHRGLHHARVLVSVSDSSPVHGQSQYKLQP